MRSKVQRHIGRAAWLVALAATLTLAAGCGAARRGEPLRTAPAPLGPQALEGRRVFLASCHQCHPGGEAGLGPAPNDKPLPDFLKKYQVRHGLGAMPSFPREKISDEQLDQLMEYLKALRRTPSAPASDRARAGT